MGAATAGASAPGVARRQPALAPALPPKQWELRAALRSVSRPSEGTSRDFANDIIAAAWELVEQDGVLDFTVKQVIERAGVALQTFYRYFGNKDELLLAMFEESMRDAAARVLVDRRVADPVEYLRHLVTTPIVMKYDERARRVMRWRGRERQRMLEFFPEAVEAVYEPYRAAIAHSIVAVCAAGRGRCEHPDVDARLILHLVQEMAHGVHGGGISDPPKVVAERVWHMVRSGLGATGADAAQPPARR
ncbi:MAG TPA: TetR/AcrR family transcriptional regulator [Acidimicrobiales bacterium]|nr:TetR/AcrR family transcriptional regulator [Acidimicrobiales bacterium]